MLWLKRCLDIFIALLLLTLFSPLIAGLALLIFLYDFASPLYIATRIGRNGVPFQMVKLRSMIVDGHAKGGSSTSARDSRITPVGRYVRALKLDEIMQFWNVLTGDMSIVGPRPNVPDGVAAYTPAEQRLLGVRPGVTDFASIVFADEGEILSGYADADRAYDELVRPWKNRLALFYLDHRSLLLDFRIMLLTALAVVSRQAALDAVANILRKQGAPAVLVAVAARREPLVRAAPP